MSETPHPQIELRLLGPPEVRTQGSPAPLQSKPLALLAYLALSGERRQRRDALLPVFWPEFDSARARQSLRWALSTLRQALGEGAIVSRGQEEVVLATDVVSCDVWRFDQERSAGHLEAAVAEYGGPLLQSVYVRDCPDFEKWLDLERERVASEYRQALEQLGRSAEARGDAREAAAWWRLLFKEDATNGKVVLHLMGCLAASGDRAGALRTFERHAEALLDELDSEPDPAVHELAERLRREPSPTALTPAPFASPSEPAVAASDSAGDLLAGRYAIQHELGRGGMGTVHLARDVKQDRFVALKTLKPDIALAVGAERFTREIRVLAGRES